MHNWHFFVTSVAMHATLIGMVGLKGDFFCPVPEPESVAFQLAPMSAPPSKSLTPAEPVTFTPKPLSPQRLTTLVSPIANKPRIQSSPVRLTVAPHLITTRSTGAWSAFSGSGVINCTMVTDSPTAGDSTNATTAETGASAKPAVQEPISLPHYNYSPRPLYPRIAKENGWAGVTVLLVEVLENGKVGRLELAQSSGHKPLDESALEAVRSWKFDPAQRHGQAVVCVIEVPIRFRLDHS